MFEGQWRGRALALGSALLLSAGAPPPFPPPPPPESCVNVGGTVTCTTVEIQPAPEYERRIEPRRPERHRPGYDRPRPIPEPRCRYSDGSQPLCTDGQPRPKPETPTIGPATPNPGPVNPKPGPVTPNPGPVTPTPGPDKGPPGPADRHPPCTICKSPLPDYPILRPVYWAFPWLALLALLLSILALLLALQRGREPERKGERAGAPIPGIGKEPGDGVLTLVPMGAEDHGFERRAGLVGLTDTDRQLLAFLDARSEELRRILCTLARMGVAWRRAEPDRARSWLYSVEPHPFYKGGQVLFDLLEWEDFMLDGPQAAADENEVGSFLRQMAEWIGLPPPNTHLTGNLPPLEPGFYLYRDVVLGAIAAAVAAFP